MSVSAKQMRTMQEWQWLRDAAEVRAAASGVSFEMQLDSFIDAALRGFADLDLYDCLPMVVREALAGTDTSFLSADAARYLQQGEPPRHLAARVAEKGIKPLRAARQIAADKAFMRRAAGR